MSELVKKVESLIASQSPRVFEDWVQQREEDDQDAIHEALNYAYRTKSFAAVHRVLRNLNDRPWTGSRDAMTNYANRKFGA